MLASMAFNLVPSFLDFSPSGPDRTHALAVQALRQDLEDRAFIGDPTELTERRRERLQAMQQRAAEEEREARRRAIDRVTTSQGSVGGRPLPLASRSPLPVGEEPQQQQQQEQHALV